MEEIELHSKEVPELRRRVTNQLQKKSMAESPTPADHETGRLLQELQVQQIELEMQNAELLQAREQMEEVLERYTDLYDFAPVGYFTLDGNGVIRAVNFAGATLLGLDRSRLLGLRFDSFIASDARFAFTSFLGTVVTNEGKKSLELELKLAPLQEGNLPLFVQIEIVSNPTVTEYRIAAFDITKRRQAEAKLHSTIRDLRTFSHSISHDLRAPLRNINSYASMFLADFGESLSKEGKNLINTVIKRTVSMENFIDDLLRFSQNSMEQLTVKPIDMTKLTNETVEKQSKEELNRNIEFRIDELPRAMGDCSMIRQVLENLISNAIKFSRKVDRPIITVGSVPNDDYNIYFVKDNGIGFDMKYIATIFVVFQRLHNSNDFEGTGVGLAIVEQIIIKHGGRVWADSKQGEGATFYFSLPYH